MPIRIDAAFQSAEDITLDAFRAPDGALGALHDRTIEVDGRTFRVSFANPNAPDVRFASYDLFWGLFAGGARAAVKSRLNDLVARLSVARDLGEAVSMTGFRENLKRTIRAEKAAIAKTAGGRFALYGFSDVRDPTLEPVNRMSIHVGADGVETQPIFAQLVNGYNESIGLKGENESAALTIAFVRDNDRGAWPYKKASEDEGSVSPKDQADWAKYLRWRDVDLFSKIRRARADATAGKTTGWAGEIARHGLLAAVHDMVRKNLSAGVVKEIPDVNLLTGAVADAILEIVDADFGDRDVKGIEAKIAEIVARHAPADKAAAVRRLLDHVAMTAFWRQTSKLGLDFFKARGETVVFDWTTFDGKKTDEASFGDRWWKDGETDVADHSGAAITHSEMRHLTGAKYAAKPGKGRLVRVEGALSADDAAKAVAAQIDSFAALDRETLDRVVESLEAGFAQLDDETFRDLAVDALASLPIDAKDDYIGTDDRIDSPQRVDELCARALARLKARISEAPSAVVKAALIAGAADAFQAEILKDPEVVERRERSRQRKLAIVRPGVPGPLALRQLAGVERSLGSQAFFSSRTGRPNALGQCLFNAGGDVLDRVGELRRAFAAAFGIAEADALSHPAFLAFVPRVAREAKGSLAHVIGSMDLVRAAFDAKEAVLAHLRARVPILPEANRIFVRRGEWDLDRLVYNEALRARRRHQNVNLDRLRRNGEVICDICTRAQAFALECARRFNPDDRPSLRLTDEEFMRLTDAYLDRMDSAVNDYRRKGEERSVQRFDDEAETAILQAMQLLVEFQDRALSYRKAATALRGFAVLCKTRFDAGLPLVRIAPERPGPGGGMPGRAEDPRETARRRDKEAQRIKVLESRVADLEERAGLLTDARLKGLLVSAVAMGVKRTQGMAGLRLFRRIKASGPLPMNDGETSKEKVQNFMRALADSVQDIWLQSLEEEARLGGDVGHDDGSKAISVAVDLYVKETPEVKAFLDREVDDKVTAEIGSEIGARLDQIPEGDPIAYVTEAVLSHVNT